MRTVGLIASAEMTFFFFGEIKSSATAGMTGATGSTGSGAGFSGVTLARLASCFLVRGGLPELFVEELGLVVARVGIQEMVLRVSAFSCCHPVRW